MCDLTQVLRGGGAVALPAPMLGAALISWCSTFGLALFPGSCAGEEEREPGTHCSRIRQVPLVNYILLRYTKISAYLLKAALHSDTPCGKHTSDFEVKSNIPLTVTVCIALFKVIGELQKGTGLHQSRAEVFSWDERVDNSCKQRAEYLRCSFVIVHTEHNQWQASFI